MPYNTIPDGTSGPGKEKRSFRVVKLQGSAVFSLQNEATAAASQAEQEEAPSKACYSTEQHLDGYCVIQGAFQLEL